MNRKPWLTSQDVAERYGVTQGAVIRWVREGRGPKPDLITSGGQARWRPETIDRDLAERGSINVA